ncbi:MAG: CAP domain-containing protein [Jejuia sp.]
MKDLIFKSCPILCGFTLLFFIASCSKDDVAEGDMQQSEALTIAEEILMIVNTHRASIGENALEFDTLANDLAYEHTLYMIDQQDINHDDFDARSDRLFSEANASRTGENVAYGQPTAQAVMDAWLNSSGHRKNIEGDFTHIGIAAVKSTSGRYYYTQIFFRQRNLNI